MQGYHDKFVVQGIHMVFDGHKGEPWGPHERRCTRLVLICRGLRLIDVEEVRDPYIYVEEVCVTLYIRRRGVSSPVLRHCG